VWGYSPNATTHTVETHIYRLRRKIEPTGASSVLQLVNDGSGYRLVLQAEHAPFAAAGALRLDRSSDAHPVAA
jgi:DNA-binding winged helix-turn-helix (wHTH) protein